MYLSRMQLDVSQRKTMIALNSPNYFHGAVEDSFKGERKRNLWRIDKLNDKYYLMILSPDKPDLSQAVKDFGFPHNDPAWETRDYDGLLKRITAGSVWHFRLTANPIISKLNKNGRGMVYNHKTPAQQKKWLMDRSDPHGFKVTENSFDVVKNQWYQFKKRRDDSGIVSILGATFEGRLQVTDPEKFISSLNEGIGKEKAYGMGLLTIVKAEGSLDD